uniref:CAZy families GH13 protein n=1 Tax=uncultured Variovorax sp. TaxID=114708 RepID=A0A060C2K2_9BURK|nr:CAZy families GH13 protein [uncultured Variovorax sp.]
MPWRADALQAGFTAEGAEPWLPIEQTHRALAVDVQWRDPASMLRFCQQWLSWRRLHPQLRAGQIRFLPAPPGVLLLERGWGSDRVEGACADTVQPLRLAFNLTSVAQHVVMNMPKRRMLSGKM